MPTIVSHAVVPIALGVGLGVGVISRRLLVAGVIASIAPDFDVVAFKLGIAYADSFGHRGASHSLAFAALLAVFAAAGGPFLRASRNTAFWFVLLAAASHPLLDMLTTGGLGAALLWPASDQRLFAPWRVIEVSPIAWRRVFSAHGLVVLRSELLWVWLPSFAACALLAIARRRNVHTAPPQNEQ